MQNPYFSRPEYRSRNALLLAKETGRVKEEDIPFLFEELNREKNDNREIMSGAALLLSNNITVARFHEEPALYTMGWELGSWFYLWWLLGSLAAVFNISTLARHRLRAEMELARLTVAPVNRIRLLHLGGSSKRSKTNSPKNLVAQCSSRYFWNLQLDSKRWQPELAVQPRLRAKNWLINTGNPDLHWAGKLIYDIHPRLLGERWSLMPLVKNHRIEYRKYKNGSVVTSANRGTQLTRGPGPLCIIHNGEMLLATTSKIRKGGQWYQSNSKLDNNKAYVTGSQGQLNPIPLPKAKEIHRFIWSSEGVKR